MQRPIARAYAAGRESVEMIGSHTSKHTIYHLLAVRQSKVRTIIVRDGQNNLARQSYPFCLSFLDCQCIWIDKVFGSVNVILFADMTWVAIVSKGTKITALLFVRIVIEGSSFWIVNFLQLTTSCIALP